MRLPAAANEPGRSIAPTAFARLSFGWMLTGAPTSIRPRCQSLGMTSFVIGHNDDPGGCEPTVAWLVAEYAAYVREEHAMCRGCPVVRSGVAIVRSMLILALGPAESSPIRTPVRPSRPRSNSPSDLQQLC